MYNNQPVKAVDNGEPTYEGILEPSNGSGWWQGHEAGSQFLSEGNVKITQLSTMLQYQWFDPEEGIFIAEGDVNSDVQAFISETESPMVLIIK